MKEIIGLTADEIKSLKREEIDRRLTVEEVLYFFVTLEIFWQFNYPLAVQGYIGQHAELKSGRHSDGFFNAKELLGYHNLMEIFADQIVMIIKELGFGNKKIDYVVGIPTAATELGKEVCRLLGAKSFTLVKVNDQEMSIEEEIEAGATVLFLDDIFTTGSGTGQGVKAAKKKQPKVLIFPYDITLLNRSGKTGFNVEGYCRMNVVSVVESVINDWDPKDCPICKQYGDKCPAVKPKVDATSFRKLLDSQKTKSA